ncbi:hypothetical protein GF373_02825 [bacterium]|nr:hypothetical protein [bacterium]
MGKKPDSEALFRPLARRINFAVWMNSSLGLFINGLGVYATLLIVLKMVWPEGTFFLHMALAFLPLTFVIGYWYGKRMHRFFQTQEIIELVDHLYKKDGSVTSYYEKPELFAHPGFYKTVYQTISHNTPRMDFMYYGKQMAPFLIYIAVALLIPPRPTPKQVQSQEILTSLTQPLAETLVENEELLPEEQKRNIEKAIEEIQKSEKNISKEQWEAVEELEKRVSDAVQHSENAVGALASTVNQLQHMMKQSSAAPNAGNLDQNKLKLLDQLSQALKDMDTMPLSSGLKKEIATASQGLKPMQLKMGKIPADQLKNALQKLGQCLGGHCKGRLGDGIGMGKGKGDGPDGDGNPGRGGINRGRGDAPMFYGDEKRISAKYEQKELSNKYLAQEDLVDMGITPLEPDPDPGQFTQGSLKNFANEEGTKVSRSRISPSQKDVIKKYFSD